MFVCEKLGISGSVIGHKEAVSLNEIIAYFAHIRLIASSAAIN